MQFHRFLLRDLRARRDWTFFRRLSELPSASKAIPGQWSTIAPVAFQDSRSARATWPVSHFFEAGNTRLHRRMRAEETGQPSAMQWIHDEKVCGRGGRIHRDA